MIVVFILKIFSIPGITRKKGTFLAYDTGLATNEYSFSTTININENSIHVNGIYLVRNKGLNFVSVINQIGEYATSHGESYENAFSFDGKARAVVILSVSNRQQYEQLVQFMFQSHKK
ncbi:hypothetical protein [Aquimarina sp. AU119]|uniref:hypothetical protein n=1 Tax=Aquimarina sp. AU119 TaxID=2108528 RepID=UPI000D692519|nr:hypothetical protein [Aquimarina sp. AU119]